MEGLGAGAPGQVEVPVVPKGQDFNSVPAAPLPTTRAPAPQKQQLVPTGLLGLTGPSAQKTET